MKRLYAILCMYTTTIDAVHELSKSRGNRVGFVICIAHVYYAKPIAL